MRFVAMPFLARPRFLRMSAALLLLSLQVARSADLESKSMPRAAALVDLADKMLRQSRFEEADAAYREALNQDAGNVRVHLGLGRIAMLLSDRRGAALHYSRAYQIEPLNPEAILAFASVVENRDARRTLLRNFVSLSRDVRVEDVLRELRIEEQIGTRKATVLRSPYTSYILPLSQQQKSGLFLSATLNGSRELRLLVDTGASGVVLNASAARGLNLEPLASVKLSGFGSGPLAPAQAALAGVFEIKDFKIENLLLEVSNGELRKDADGVVGLDLFEDFLIRVNGRTRTLELTPFRETKRPEPCPDCLKTYRAGGLLLVRGRVNGHMEGCFIVDSGVPYTLISTRLLSRGRLLNIAEGVQGDQNLLLPSEPFSIQLGQKHFFDSEYATIDTEAISSGIGSDIAGSIGFSLLRDMAWTINYRDGWVKLEKPD
jgi:hypothetical protein